MSKRRERSNTTAARETSDRSPGSELAARSGLRVRPHRPARALAGAFLVVAAVTAGVALYTRIGDRTEVLALTRTVLAGEQITSGDLRVVSISSDDALTTIDATLRVDVVGQFARVRLAAGALLVPEALQSGPLVSPDRVLMSIEVPAGQIPVGLREQSRVVLVVSMPGSDLDGEPPVLVEATVTAVPRNLTDVVGGGETTQSMVALSVEVPAATVSVVGSAESVSIGVLDPAADFSDDPESTSADEPSVASTEPERTEPEPTPSEPPSSAYSAVSTTVPATVATTSAAAERPPVSATTAALVPTTVAAVVPTTTSVPGGVAG